MAQSIGHIQIPSGDLNESRAFYGNLFGWQFEPHGSSYLLFDDGENGVGGGFTTEWPVCSDAGPVIYVMVDNIENILEHARHLGGSVAMQRSSAGGGDGSSGWIAAIIDPHGNRIGLFTTSSAEGS